MATDLFDIVSVPYPFNSAEKFNKNVAELCYSKIEPAHDKTNKMIYASSEDLDKPGHFSSLTRAFAVHFMGSQGLKLSS